jgi:putative Holliday junction resolvase
MADNHRSTQKTGAILALDFGEKRIGLAIAHADVAIAMPLDTLQRNARTLDEIETIIQSQHVQEVVVGRPRGLSGQPTAQTTLAEQFAKDLSQKTTAGIHLQDEALTSKKAETELQTRGKEYTKPEVDALAATYILEDFLSER